MWGTWFFFFPVVVHTLWWLAGGPRVTISQILFIFSVPYGKSSLTPWFLVRAMAFLIKEKVRIGGGGE